MTDMPPREESERPLVTVLVPSYNGAKWVREALDSILAQTYPRMEVILLDDHSDDDTPDIAATYGDRITYVRQPQNLGIYDNVNVGIAMARGEFIATYHADDIYLPTIVEEQVRYLTAHPDVGAVFCADIFVDAVGEEYHRLVLPPEIRGDRPIDYGTVLNALLTYKNSFLVCPSAMVRASTHARVGVYDQARYKNTGDLEMWLRIARHYPIAVLGAHLMKYRHFHGNSSQRYHRLRTAPENYFFIMDEYLAGDDRQLATPEALAHFEAHRAKDRLMAAIAHYIKNERPDAQRVLREMNLGAVLQSNRVQRWRLLIMATALWPVVRLPRIDTVARLMQDRWHTKHPPKRRIAS